MKKKSTISAPLLILVVFCLALVPEGGSLSSKLWTKRKSQEEEPSKVVNTSITGPARRPVEETAASTEPTFDPAAPQMFTDGPVRVILPGRPERKTVPAKDLNRSFISYSLKDPEGGVFEFGYLDANGNWPDRTTMIANRERLYDYVEIYRASRLNATCKDTDLLFRGQLARLFELTYSRGKDLITERTILCLTGTRLYYIGCAGPAKWLDSPEVLKFMGSFQVVPPGEPVPVDLLDFKWEKADRSRDVKSLAVAVEESLYSDRVPHLDYLPDYPYYNNDYETSGPPRPAHHVVLEFYTRSSYHDTFTFYVNKLRQNSFSFEKGTPAGIIAGQLDLDLNDKKHYHRVCSLRMVVKAKGTGTVVRIEWCYQPKRRVYC